MNWKIFPLLKLEILVVFANTLTDYENYPFEDSGICSSVFKCNSRKNEKLFLNFLFHLWNVHQILNIFKKKMIMIANAFLKLHTVKDLFKPLSRMRPCRTSFDRQRVNGCQRVVRSAWEDFYHIYWWLSQEMIWKYLWYWTLIS